MPTGYTAKLMSEGQTFREFALTCARNFGACICLRDHPMDVLPTEDNINGDSYYKKRKSELDELLLNLRAMTPAEFSAHGEALKKTRLEQYKNSLAAQRAEIKKVADMREQVAQWNPPTDDHEGLKAFMLQQLNLSLEDDGFYVKQIRQLEELSGVRVAQIELESAEENLKRCEDALKREDKNARSSKMWIRALTESLNEDEFRRKA